MKIPSLHVFSFGLVLTVSSMCVLVACGSSSDPGPSGGVDSGSGFDGSTPDTGSAVFDSGGSTDGASDAPSDASDAGASDAALKAPYFETLKPNDAGSLTATWTNLQPDCDAIEGERKDGLHPYAVAITAAGNETSKVDPTATLNQNYTYRLRCKKGATYSPYSFEMSANPQN